MDPQQAEMFRQVLAGMGGAAGNTSDLDARARQGTLTFKATIKAMQSGCPCEPCALLRQALNVMMGEDEGKGEPSVASVSPPAPAVSPPS